MRGNLWRAAAAAVALGAAGEAVAQTAALDRAKVIRQVADQKADADVRGAIDDADRIARVNPAKAVQALKRAIVGLDVQADISSEKRNELVAKLQGKIAVLEGKPAANPLDPKIALQKEASRKLFEQYLAEAKDVRDSISDVEKLRNANRNADAIKKIADLYAKYPNNPSVIALAGQGDFGDKIAVAKGLAKEQADRTVLAFNDMMKSTLLPKGDIEFPADWKEKTELRRKLEPKLLDEESEAILRALEKRVGDGLKNAPFLESVQTLSNLVGKEVYLDKKSLEDAGLDLSRPVNMPGNVTARTALRAVLQAQGLTFVIKDKIIQVVTLEKAKELQVTRAYYLGDLIQAQGAFGGAVTWGPQIDYEQTMQNAKIIIDSITQSVDPLSWQARGGTSTITFHYPSMSLIVRAPAEVHASLKLK